MQRFFPARISLLAGTALTAAALMAAALTAAGCGGGTSSSSGTRSTGAAPKVAAAGDLAVLIRPAPPPGGWRAARIPSGAILYFPPSWTAERGDAGTATAVTRGARGQLAGYLNITPRQDGEKLIDWPSFRVRHDEQEGDREVVSEAVAHGVRFSDGPGSCVRDSYTTVSRARFTEIACLVNGRSASTVIVAAAPLQALAQASPVLYRALGALRT